MKDILYYTVVRDYHRYRVLGVTSETRYGRINGRYVEDDKPTHTTKISCCGHFDDKEVALNKITDIARIRAKYVAVRKPHDQAIAISHADERKEIEELLR
jgi:hypothetical protein